MLPRVDRSPSPGAWPLSAPATALLRAPDTAPHELLRMAVRELVVRGVLRVELVEQPAEVRLTRGHVDAAAALDSATDAGAGGGGDGGDGGGGGD